MGMCTYLPGSALRNMRVHSGHECKELLLVVSGVDVQLVHEFNHAEHRHAVLFELFVRAFQEERIVPARWHCHAHLIELW